MRLGILGVQCQGDAQFSDSLLIALLNRMEDAQRDMNVDVLWSQSEGMLKLRLGLLVALLEVIEFA